MLLSLNISIEDLVYQIADEDTPDIVRLVKWLDEIVGDWDFTFQLAKYFEQQKNIAISEGVSVDSNGRAAYKTSDPIGPD